jgi:hypothetical protein
MPKLREIVQKEIEWQVLTGNRAGFLSSGNKYALVKAGLSYGAYAYNKNNNNTPKKKNHNKMIKFT